MQTMPLKISFLIILGILGFELNYAQITQKGFIIEQNSDRSPIPGVQLIAIDALPTDTDNSGLFLLEFNSKKQGDLVTVTELRKKGYELVNDREVYENWVISTEETLPFNIVMCKEGLLTKNKLHYYQIAEEELTSAYQQKVTSLQKQLSQALINEETFRTKAKELSNQLSSQQRQIGELADRFARTNFDEVLPVVEKAFNLFQSGNINGAIELLEAEELEDKLVQIVNKEKQISTEKKALLNYEQRIGKQKKEYTKALIDKAGYYKINFQFDEAEQAYRTAAMADTNNFEGLFLWARYLDEQNDLDASIQVYLKALGAAKGNKIQVAKCYNYLGNVYRYKRDFEKAESYLIQAQQIRESLPIEEMPIYKNDLASTIHNLGENQFRQNNFLAAIPYYQRASELVKQIKGFDDSYQVGYAKTLNSWGNALKQLNDYGGAEQKLKAAIGILDNLNGNDSIANEGLLAKVTMNLGILYNDMNNFCAAEECYLKSIEIKTRLAKINPSVYKIDLAYLYANFGKLNNDLGKDEESEHNYLLALDILKALVKKDPESYELFYAGVLNNLGITYAKLHEFTKAEQVFMEAISIKKYWAQKYPEAYEPDLAKTKYSLGFLFFDLERFDEAENLFLEVDSIYDIHTPLNPWLLPDRARNFNALGVSYKNQGKHLQSETYYLKTLDLYQKLADETPDRYDLRLIETYNNLSRLYLVFSEKKNKTYLKKGKDCLLKLGEILGKYPDEAPYLKAKAMQQELEVLYSKKND